VKIVLKSLLVMILGLTPLYAKECSNEEIIKLVNAGYDKNKIDSLCENSSAVQQADTKEVSQTAPSEIDSWFFRFGIGAVAISYPDEVQFIVDNLEALNYVERTKLAIDMGFYFPVNRNYMLGFNINGHADNFRNTLTNAETNINVYNYALSNIYFFDEVEDGFFARGDIGFTKAIIDATNTTEAVSDTGLGLAIGAGYCFNLNVVSLQTELLFTNYSIEGETVNSTQLLFSVLF